MKKTFFGAILAFMMSCYGQEKTDLIKLKLDEQVENLISDTSEKNIGTNSVEYPFGILVEDTDSTTFSVSGIPVKSVYFLLHAKVHNDSVAKYGGGHFEGTYFKSREQLLNNLSELKKKQNVESRIFGFRAEIDKTTTAEIKKLLTKLYGIGTKNPNTDHGLYWNLKDQNRYIFFAPDYNRLIILNSSHLSKSCYWDGQNGIIDFGNCQIEEYFQKMGVNIPR